MGLFTWNIFPCEGIIIFFSHFFFFIISWTKSIQFIIFNIFSAFSAFTKNVSNRIRSLVTEQRWCKICDNISIQIQFNWQEMKKNLICNFTLLIPYHSNLIITKKKMPTKNGRKNSDHWSWTNYYFTSSFKCWNSKNKAIMENMKIIKSITQPYYHWIII